MDPTIVGVVGILLLFMLILTGLHLGLVLCLVGGLGLVLLTGFKGGLMVLGSTPFATASAYDLSPLPLFLLMGAFRVGLWFFFSGRRRFYESSTSRNAGPQL